MIAAAERLSGEPYLIRFVEAEGAPYDLLVVVEIHEDGVAVVKGMDKPGTLQHARLLKDWLKSMNIRYVDRVRKGRTLRMRLNAKE